MIKATPSFPRVEALSKSRKWQSWDGYAIADTYGFQIAPEYLAVRKKAAIFDFFPLNVLYITGPDAAILLDRVVTRSMSRCRPNQVMYTALCDHKGKLLDDGTVIRLADDTYQLSTNTSLLGWLHENSTGLDVSIKDMTLEINTLQLQGPESRNILNSISDQSVDKLKYFNVMSCKLGDIPVMISRTGFTGGLGYEVWSESSHAIAVWDILMEAGAPFGALPAGFTALDLVRIEAALLWYEFDFMPARFALTEADKCSPLEVGLDWVVDLSKPDFIGRDAIVREKDVGVSRSFVGLELDANILEKMFAPTLDAKFDENSLVLQDLRNPWRTPTPIMAYVDGESVGNVTAGCWSPACKAYIAMACLKTDAINKALKGDNLTLRIDGKEVPAKFREMPFYNPEEKRAVFD